MPDTVAFYWANAGVSSKHTGLSIAGWSSHSSSTVSAAEPERRAASAFAGAGGIEVALQSAVHVYRRSCPVYDVESERRAVSASSGAGGIIVAQRSALHLHHL